MTHHAIRVPLRLSGLAVAAFLLAATPAGVAATTNAPIAQTGGMTATLPLLGTPLTVAVTLDSVGNISGVALDPSTALSKTKSGDDFVKFSNKDGTVKVTVKAIAGRLSIKARAKTLSDVLGTRTWSADVFGTGAKSTASYTIGKDSAGKPTVAIGTVNPAAGVGWKLGPFVATKVTPSTAKPGAADKSKAKGAHAAADGTFSWQGFTKSLTISVNVAGDGTASLAITLSGRDAQKLTGTLASLVAGARTWSAHTCDGTAVSVKYHVASNGTVVYDGATGATATEKTIGTGFMASFDKNRVALFTSLVHQPAGTYALFVHGRSGECSHRDPGGFGTGHGSAGGHGQWGPPAKSSGKSKSH
jgi:hypothetical protein